MSLAGRQVVFLQDATKAHEKNWGQSGETPRRNPVFFSAPLRLCGEKSWRNTSSQACALEVDLAILRMHDLPRCDSGITTRAKDEDPLKYSDPSACYRNCQSCFGPDDLVGIITLKPWAWCMTILFSTYALYAAFESTMGYRFPGRLVEVQFGAAPWCVLLLMLGHCYFAIKRRDVIFLCVGFVLSVTVIYVLGRYFPEGTIDHVWPLPYWRFIYASSNLRGPLTLLLMWGCYFGIAALASSFPIIRRALRFS